MSRLAFVVAFLFSSVALAAVAPKAISIPVLTGVTAADLSTGPVTSTMDVDGFTRMKLQLRLTRGGTATNIGITCEESDDGTTWSEIQRDTAGTLTAYAATRTTSVSVNVTVVFQLYAYVNMRCTITGASANSSDLVTAIARVSRGN